MIKCAKCVLPAVYPGIVFDERGICNYCNSYKSICLGEKKLLRYFYKAKRKKCKYDALVPLSGGRDSAYILYLATKIYKLNVMAFTYNNGFLAQAALRNINITVKNAEVDHILFNPSWDLLKKIYKISVIKSGELCSPCGIGIANGCLKIAADWNIPLILFGNSPVERGSYTPEMIYDIPRFKKILYNSEELTKNEIERFLIHLNYNPIYSIILNKLGFYSSRDIINPLDYIDRKSEAEIGQIINKELGWEDVGGNEYTKHFDCIAEPFSNFLREKRYGYSRRMCHLSNLIRMGQIDRHFAEEILKTEKEQYEPQSCLSVLDKLGLSKEDLEKAIAAKTFQYSSFSTKLVYLLRPIYNKLKKI